MATWTRSHETGYRFLGGEKVSHTARISGAVWVIEHEGTEKDWHVTRDGVPVLTSGLTLADTKRRAVEKEAARHADADPATV